MSLLLARLGSSPVVPLLTVGTADGLALVVGVGRNGAAVDGVSHRVRKIYEVDPPNRFWPDPSIRTY